MFHQRINLYKSQFSKTHSWQRLLNSLKSFGNYHFFRSRTKKLIFSALFVASLCWKVLFNIAFFGRQFSSFKIIGKVSCCKCCYFDFNCTFIKKLLFCSKWLFFISLGENLMFDWDTFILNWSSSCLNVWFKFLSKNEVLK